MNLNDLAELIRDNIAVIKRPIAVAISGAAALGKSHFAIALEKCLSKNDRDQVSIISTDGYLLDRQRRKERKLSGYDPAAMDIKQLENTVRELLTGSTVGVPIYDHSDGTVAENAKCVYPGDVTIIEGIQSCHPRLLKFIDYAVFFEADQHTALRLRRYVDTRERGYTEQDVQKVETIEHQFYQQHVEQDRHVANVVVRVAGNWQYSIWRSEAK